MPPHDSLPSWLSHRLGSPLPGRPVHAQFAPELNYGRHQIPPFPDTRRAAVLILLFPNQAQWFIPLTIRPVTMSTHAGQISFPGGEIEPGETVEQAAAREYEEELGPPPSGMVLLGRLTPILVYASNYHVTPCVAASSQSPDYRPSPCEVAQVLDASLADLAAPTSHGTHWIQRGGVQFQAPHIDYRGHCIWGATSMMLAELIALWHEFKLLTG